MRSWETVLEPGCVIMLGLNLFLQTVLQIQCPHVITDNQKHKDKIQKKKKKSNEQWATTGAQNSRFGS